VFPADIKLANISRLFVNKSMPDHLVLVLEALATYRSRAPHDRTVVRLN
jgi:hypothetical protein